MIQRGEIWWATLPTGQSMQASSKEDPLYQRTEATARLTAHLWDSLLPDPPRCSGGGLAAWGEAQTGGEL